MAASPALNARGMRALLLALELMPFALGYGARFRRMRVDERVRFLASIERNRNAQVRQLVKVMKSAAFLAYYGDDAVMRQIGYDAEANLQRARALRELEGRP